MYKPTIGLEVHAELKTKSKMFCGCMNEPHASEPNTNICPVCLAHPGTLPVANATAVQSVLLFGTAVDGTLAEYSEFDRKNYFYPDIPKAYQISQYAFPFVTGGVLAGVELTRVHLEEDTARSQHDKGGTSLVDFNRAGVPLMELVTEPVIHDAETAGAFARELQLLLRTLGISDANMEKGEMRVEANISVSQDETLGTKVEVKNLNSFRSVESAINYEIARQSALLEAGKAVVQETRGWNESTLETFPQRSKETAKDYRYFPDPDLPKLVVSEIDDFTPTRLSEIMPVLPQEKREKYEDIGLASNQVETIIQQPMLDTYFTTVMAEVGTESKLANLCANYLVTDMAPVVLLSDQSVDAWLPPSHFVALMRAVEAREITSRVAKDLIIECALSDTDVLALATDRGLLSAFSVEDLQKLVQQVLERHPDVVAEYRGGKTAVLQFLLGQVMKETKGAADPAKLKGLFEEALQ